LNTEANSYDTLKECVLNVQAAAGNARHRGALVLSGDRAWSRQTAVHLIGTLPFTHIMWVGDDAPEGFKHRLSGLAHTVLGQEFDAVILDAWSGLDVDDLGALVGVIKAGGIFFMLCPPFAQWATYSDPAVEKMHIAGAGVPNLGRYLQRFIQVIESDDQVLVVEENADLPEVEVSGKKHAQQYKLQGKTSDQVEAIDSIKALAASSAPGAFAVIADRGRGKSSALGMAASEIVQDETSRIILTAPRFSAVSQVYENFSGVEERFQFVAPDELLRNPQTADLLMIDEAAAIPVQILVSLLEHYPRVVFATTVHGYEGSGRGFEIRFSSLLNELRPGWKKLVMHQPVRWAEGDPLESFSFRLLLLDAQPAYIPDKQSVHASECSYVQLSRDELVDNEPQLSEVFGLLVMAHYRTRPFDLRYLLDAPDVEIHALLYEGHVVAVVMISTEGGFDVETSDAIFAGVRRPRGHLLAQSLAAHCGVELAPVYRYARIVRIAVHPDVQGQGLGSRLLEEVTRSMHASGYVALGASFAADPRVMRFWRNHHYSPVHVGVMREHTTGSYPMLMLRPLGLVGEQVCQEALSRFIQRYQVLRETAYADIDEDIRIQLEEVTSVQVETMPDFDHELLAFIYAHRGLELSLPAIRAYLDAYPDWHYLSQIAPLQQELLERCIVQLQTVSEAAQGLELSGRREALSLIRSNLARLIEHQADPEFLAYRDRLIELKAS